MKILTASQFKQLDLYTIEHEPISSLDLMERAATVLANRIAERWSADTPVKIFAGPGNNGGDALALARLLSRRGRKVSVWLFNIKNSSTLSAECEQNRKRLSECPEGEFNEVVTSFAPPALTPDDLVVDGLFGIGIARPLNGGFAEVVKYINSSPSTVVSIDVPSGLMCEDNSYNVMNHIVKADVTYTFHRPKLAYFFADMYKYVGEWHVLDIGEPETILSDSGEDELLSPYATTDADYVKSHLHPRPKFAHKGTMGHVALVAGKRGMAGCAILASRACMRTGAGKITVHTPYRNSSIMQIAVPEAIVQLDKDGEAFSTTFDANDFDALGIGPGIGTSQETAQAFIEQLRLTRSPIVIDADGLNILGSHRGWIQQLPRQCILTPHKKELFGLISNTRNDYEELERTRELAVHQQIYIIIKGAYSAVCTPEGSCFFNTTGNPGMATAGSGDVLTGVILSLLGQGYSHEEACRIGVYIHGLAGDIASERLGEDGVMASDIIDALPAAFMRIKSL